MSYELLPNVSKRPSATMLGIGDLMADRDAGVVWLWNETRPFVAKFRFQDRIDVNDVNQVITDIANYIASASGSSDPGIPSSAQAIFWNDLCPNTQSEWKKTSTWSGHPTYTGYRLNPETIRKAGTSIGESVSAFRSMVGGGGSGGSTGGGGTESSPASGLQWSWVTSLLKNPWALLGIAAAAVGTMYVVKKRRTAGKGRRR